MRIENPNMHSDYEDWPQPVKRGFRIDPINPIKYGISSQFSRVYNTPGDFREGHETRDIDFEKIFKNDGMEIPNLEAYNYYLEQSKSPPLFQKVVLDNSDPNDEEIQFSNMNFDQVQEKQPMLDLKEFWDRSVSDDPVSQLSPYYVSTSEFLTKNRLKSDLFNQHYNTPEKFRQGYESRDGVMESKDENDEIREPRIYIDEDEMEHHKDETGSGEIDEKRLADLQRQIQYLSRIQDHGMILFETIKVSFEFS